MALDQVIKFVLSDDKTYFTATDETGVFNDPDNLGGYGGDNPSTGDITAMSIYVTTPDATTLLPTNTEVAVSVYPTLPSAASGTFDLTSLLILGEEDTVLIDGWYKFRSVAVTAEETLEFEFNVLVYDTVKCCIDNMLVKAVGCGCSGSSTKIMNIVKAQGSLAMMEPRLDPLTGEMIESIIDQCGQYNKGVALLLELQDICDTANCGGCSGCH